MNVLDAQVIAEKAIAKDFKNIPKYSIKAIAFVEKHIIIRAEEGRYQLKLSQKDVCDSVKLRDTSNEIWLSTIAYIKGNGFQVQASEETLDYGRERFVTISWSK